MPKRLDELKKEIEELIKTSKVPVEVVKEKDRLVIRLKKQS